MLKKQLDCDLMLDWIYHKFLKLNFLRKIKSYVGHYANTQSLHSQAKCIAGFFLELCTESQRRVSQVL